MMAECVHEDADYSWGETCDTCGDRDGKCSTCGAFYDHIKGWPNESYTKRYKEIICPLCKEVVLKVISYVPPEIIDIFAYHLREELREQIAQEIEAKCVCPESKNTFMSCEFEEAAIIARGNNANL
jgi:rubredoxin